MTRGLTRIRDLLLALGLLFAAIAAAPAAQAQTIGQITIEGNQRVEAATVRSYLTVVQGDVPTPERIDQSLKSLFATGLFSDVQIRREGSNLIVSVVENPIINQLAFEGNRRLDTKQLEAEVQLRPRIVYTRARVQSDVQRLIQLYRRSGRYAATVEPKVIQLPQNRVDLVFEIDEGPETKIEKVSFIGNERFGDRDLRGVIQSKESAFYRLFSTNDRYDPDRLTLDRELLRRHYLRNGFADFRVVSANAELSPDRRDFFLTFAVEEGEQYKVRKLDIESKLQDLTPGQLRSQLKFAPREIYNADKIESSIKAITFELGRLGYAFTDVRPRTVVDRDNREIDITFEVNEGPRVYVERINLVGNVRTLDRVVRREFRLAEGDAFNAAKLRRSQQRIRALGFFNKVDLKDERGSAPDKSVITMEVAERSTGELTFGLGYSTSDGPLGDVSIRERNLLGKGQDLRAGFTLSGRRQEIDTSFTEPYFLDRNIAAGFDIFRATTDQRDESSFDSTRLGFQLRAGYPLTENLRQQFSYTLREDTVDNIEAGASRFVREQEGTRTTSGVGHRLTYDMRDDRFEPTQGYRIQFDTTLAGFGGAKRYLKNQVDYTYYIPVADKIVASLGFLEGYIFGLDRDIRIEDRFFAGGNNFRGFATGGVGPRDKLTGDSLGANLFYVGTAELRFPLGLPPELGVAGRVFTQAGSAAGIDTNNNAGLFDVGSIRVSSGVGMTWSSPFGPIRFDLAKALIKEDLDRTQFFSFSFGTRF